MTNTPLLFLQRHGNGTETTTYEGYWKRGQKYGNGIRRLPNGIVQMQVEQDINLCKLNYIIIMFI